MTARILCMSDYEHLRRRKLDLWTLPAFGIALFVASVAFLIFVMTDGA